MDAGIDHEASGAPELVGETAEVLIGIGEQAHLLAQALGIERPAFAEGRQVEQALEHRCAFTLLGQGQLEVVAGNALVIGQCFHLVGRQVPHVQRVGVVDAGA